jgi:hypothetical protein
LKVASATKGAGGSYTFTALFLAPSAGQEREPNDRAVDANVLSLGQQVSGFIGHAGDEDWYRIELPVAADTPPAPPPAPPPPPSPAPEGSTASTEGGEGGADAGHAAAAPPKMPDMTPQVAL